MFKKILIILAAVFMMCSVVCGFELLDTSATTSLNIKYIYDDIEISGAEFKLYKVADVSADVQYTATEQFAPYAVSFDMRDDGGRSLAQTLAAYVSRDDIDPLYKGTTDINGITEFKELNTGLYLAVSLSYKYSGFVYTPEPLLVCLPNYEEKKWVNDVTATPKVSRENAPGSGGGGGTVPDPRIDIGVLKVWEEDDDEKRPESVEVQLLRNGDVYHTAILSKQNGWHYTWDDLPEYGDYSVTEKTVPEGYTVGVTREGNAFVVTNTGPGVPKEPEIEATTEEKVIEEETKPGGEIQPPEPNGGKPPVINEPVIPEKSEEVTDDPYGTSSGRGGRANASTSRNGSGDDDDTPNVPGLPGSTGGSGSRYGSASGGNGLPQTGQLQWPVPIMATSGCILFLLGFIRHKEEELKISKDN